MNKDIKFRAWDELRKIMYSSKCINLLLHFDGELQSTDDKGNILGTINTPEMIIMQYTGLKDKNGKEIYEGDILRLHNGKIRTVFRVKGGFAIESLDMDVGKHGKIFCCPIESLADEQNAGYIENQAEVIGNIHDNPELLGVANGQH